RVRRMRHAEDDLSGHQREEHVRLIRRLRPLAEPGPPHVLRGLVHLVPPDRPVTGQTRNRNPPGLHLLGHLDHLVEDLPAHLGQPHLVPLLDRYMSNLAVMPTKHKARSSDRTLTLTCQNVDALGRGTGAAGGVAGTSSPPIQHTRMITVPATIASAMS